MTMNDPAPDLDRAPAQVRVPGSSYIDGTWMSDSEGPALHVHDPADGRRIAELPSAGAGQARAAVLAAATAYPAWSAL